MTNPKRNPYTLFTESRLVGRYRTLTAALTEARNLGPEGQRGSVEGPGDDRRPVPVPRRTWRWSCQRELFELARAQVA